MTDAYQHQCSSKPENIAVYYVAGLVTKPFIFADFDGCSVSLDVGFCPYCGEKLTKGDTE